MPDENGQSRAEHSIDDSPKRCASCAHWTGDPEDRWQWHDDDMSFYWHNGVALNEETHEPMNPQPRVYRTCAGVPFYVKEGAEASLAVVKDGSGYSGRLIVRDDFGCVLWKTKS